MKSLDLATRSSKSSFFDRLLCPFKGFCPGEILVRSIPVIRRLRCTSARLSHRWIFLHKPKEGVCVSVRDFFSPAVIT